METCVWCFTGIEKRNRYYHVIDVNDKFLNQEIKGENWFKIREKVKKYIRENGDRKKLIISGLWPICNKHKSNKYITLENKYYVIGKRFGD